MKTEFTPGPWKVKQENTMQATIITEPQIPIMINSYYIIAEVYAANEPMDVTANAKLIAAAPEMLGALNSLKMSIAAHPDCTDGSEFADFVSLAERIIKKATE